MARGPDNFDGDREAAGEALERLIAALYAAEEAAGEAAYIMDTDRLDKILKRIVKAREAAESISVWPQRAPEREPEEYWR